MPSSTMSLTSPLSVRPDACVMSSPRVACQQIATGARACLSQRRAARQTVRMPARIHGILVTYHRPESLAAMVEQLAEIGLATLTVVDNGPSPESKESAHIAAARVPTTYIEMDENTGP